MDSKQNNTSNQPGLNLLLAMVIFGVTLTVYLWNGEYRVNGQSGDTTSNQLLPISLLNGKGFTFDGIADPDDLPYSIGEVNGKLISLYPILPGILNTVTYSVAEITGLSEPIHPDLPFDTRAYLSLVTGAITTALSVVFLFLLLCQQKISIPFSLSLSAIYAFGTSTYSVASRGIWQHGPALMFITLGLLLLRSNSSRLLAISGLCFGLAVECRVPVAFLVLPLFFIPWQKGLGSFMAFSAGFAVPILLMRIYAWYFFGSPFVLAENTFNSQLAFFGDNIFTGFAGVFLSPGRGLLIYTPFVIFGFIGMTHAIKNRNGFLICIGIGIFAYIVLNAVWHSWWGGKSFGTRMMTEIFPGMMILAAGPILGWWRSRIWQKVTVIVVVFWSVLTNTVGASYYPQMPWESRALIYERVWSIQDNELSVIFRHLKSKFGL